MVQRNLTMKYVRVIAKNLKRDEIRLSEMEAAELEEARSALRALDGATAARMFPELQERIVF